MLNCAQLKYNVLISQGRNSSRSVRYTKRNENYTNGRNKLQLNNVEVFHSGNERARFHEVFLPAYTYLFMQTR